MSCTVTESNHGYIVRRSGRLLGYNRLYIYIYIYIYICVCENMLPHDSILTEKPAPTCSGPN